MAEIDAVQQFLLNKQLIAVAKWAQHCPHCLCARLFNEEGMQKQEALQSQPIIIQALQKRPFKACCMTGAWREIEDLLIWQKQGSLQLTRLSHDLRVWQQGGIGIAASAVCQIALQEVRRHRGREGFWALDVLQSRWAQIKVQYTGHNKKQLSAYTLSLHLHGEVFHMRYRGLKEQYSLTKGTREWCAYSWQALSNDFLDTCQLCGLQRGMKALDLKSVQLLIIQCTILQLHYAAADLKWAIYILYILDAPKTVKGGPFSIRGGIKLWCVCMCMQWCV